MKKLYLLFGFALMGVLFFACQKDEPVVEEIAVDSNEMLSVERTINCSPCLDAGGCCCRLISTQGEGNYHDAQLCFLNAIFEIDNPYGSFSQGTIPTFGCTIPSTNCNQDTVSTFYYNIYFPNDLPKNPVPDSTGLNPLYAHGFFAGFCSAPNNLFQVCNPEPDPISMAFSCELDSNWEEFVLQPGECIIFRIQGCSMTVCN